MRGILAGFGLSVVAVFALMAITLAGPLTPIKFDVGGGASILNPYFSQNWQLFAPDPISDERGVVARFRCSGKVTDWRDITSRSVERTQSSRFFPPRESRIVSNALMERFAQDDLTERLEQKHKQQLAPLDPGGREHADQILARYGAATVGCGSGADQPTAVQLRFVTRPLTPWSERNTKREAEEPTTFDSEWIAL